MRTYLVHLSKKRALPKLPDSEPKSIRRIFNNDQLIERHGRWLLACHKSENTRVNYVLAAKQFAEFLVNKPLTAATKEDVRAWIFSLYTKPMAPATIQTRLDSLRTLFDCLQLGSQVRASVPRFVRRRKLPKRLPHAISEEAGLRNARAKGKQLGRPKKTLDTKRIAALRGQGVGWKRIAEEMGVGVGTIYRVALDGSKTPEKVF